MCDVERKSSLFDRTNEYDGSVSLVFASLTSGQNNTSCHFQSKGCPLRCPQCRYTTPSKWGTTECNVTSCPSATHRGCLSLEAQLIQENGTANHIIGYFYNKTCIEYETCSDKEEESLCQGLRTTMWRKQENLYARDCEAKCSARPEPTTPPSTRLPATTILKPEQACFACTRDSLTTLCRGKPKKIRCGSSAYDSCFTLKATTVNISSGAVVEQGEWRDCAVEARDCGARENQCERLRKWLKAQGLGLKVCNAECCRGDHCNSFVPTPSEPKVNPASGAFGLCCSRVSLLLSSLALVLSFQY